MIFRRNFLRSFLIAPFMGFFDQTTRASVMAMFAKPMPPTFLDIPEPPYPYAYGETYSQAGMELQICIDPYGEGWKSVPWFKIGEIMHIQIGEPDVIPQNYRHLRMIVKDVDLKGGVITLAGFDDGNDANQIDPLGEPWRMSDPLTPDIFS